MRCIAGLAGKWWKDLHLAWLQARFGGSSKDRVVRCAGYTLRITDGPSFFIQYKDIFVRHIYHFTAQRPDPLIIDGGSNIGISVLYFKGLYPQARIVAIEPDPAIFRILQENVARNCLCNVQLVNAALDETEGTTTFLADGSVGGRIGEGGLTVPVKRLSEYLNAPVEFLKLNIEGREWSVLREASMSGGLRNVRNLVLEYHGWAGSDQRLGAILDLLDREGFRYLVHDFDAVTCRASKPPFRLTPDTAWFCLVWAQGPAGLAPLA